MAPSQYQDVPPAPYFIPSPSFVITCACLTVDPATNRVLLARNPLDTQPACHIPQGPKNVDEGLLSAAVRHTLESAGTTVEPLRIRVPTRAGLWHYDDGHAASGGDEQVVEGLENCEPFAVCEVDEGGARRIVFYFLAGKKRVEGKGGVWASVADVDEGLAGLSAEEGMVVKTGLELTRRAGIMS